MYSDELINFFVDLFKVDDSDFKKALTSFLKNDESLLIDVLFANPKNVSTFSEEPTFIRSLWYEILLNDNRPIYPVYCSMLGQDLIPKEELDESIRHVINSNGIGAPNDSYIQILEHIDFFKVFYKVAFEEDKLWSFKWSNSNKHLIVFYLDRYQLDETIIECLCDNFSNQNHPFELATSLNAFFRENEKKRKKAALLITENQFKEPTYIKPIVQELSKNSSPP